MLTTIRARLVVMIAIVIAMCSAAHADVERMLSLVPNDAVAFVAVPDLRQLNDAIAHTLDGMDRSTAIFGSRPIDAMKSMLGMSVAVHERRPAAMIFMPRHDDDRGVEVVWLVPVTEAKAFLGGNFRRIDEQHAASDPVRVHHRRFGELFATSLDGHVALSNNRGALEGWNMAGAMPDGWQAWLSDASRRVMGSGEIIAWASDWACEQWGPFISDSLDRLAMHVPAIGPLRSIAAALISDEFVDTVVAIDLDPLGVFVRISSRVEGDAKHVWTRPEAEPPQHLHSLPHGPFQFALAMDQRGMKVSRQFLQRLGLRRLAQSLELPGEATQLDFAAYAASSAGILGRAIAVAESDEGDVRAALANATLPWQHDGSERVWREAQHVPLRAQMRAHEYEVRLEGTAGLSGMLPPLLFGPAGWQGYVIDDGRRAAMTFSRARLSHELAVNALDGGGRSLGEDPTLKSMMNWLPNDPALVGFVNIGMLTEQFKSLLQPMLATMEMRVPDIAPGLPPIAVAVAVEDDTVEATAIIPAGVLAIGYDLAGASILRQRFLTPRNDRDVADE
jgi:hypothetical protein